MTRGSLYEVLTYVCRDVVKEVAAYVGHLLDTGGARKEPPGNLR